MLRSFGWQMLSSMIGEVSYMNHDWCSALMLLRLKCSLGSLKLSCIIGGLVSCCFGWKVFSSTAGEVYSSVSWHMLSYVIG